MSAHRYAPMNCGRELERVLIVPDTHAPFHDQDAWDVMVKYAKKFEPHTIIHLGDWADCYSVSAHSKDPRRMQQLGDEMKVVKELRAELDSLGAERKIAALGNHEDRLRRHVEEKSPALASLMDVAELMALRENGWKVVPYNDHGALGKMYFTHEAGYSGKNAVTQTGEAFSASVVFGHTHRLGSMYFGDVTGRRHVSASLGWLGRLQDADYVSTVKKRFWTTGFGTARMARDGRFQLELIPIVDGRCVLGGKVIE